MNTVVLYTSHYGATERYARALAAALGAPCFALGEEDVQAVHRAGRIVYGGGLYAGGVGRALQGKEIFFRQGRVSVYCGAGPDAAAGGAR